MENTPYHDSPPPSRSSSPTRPTRSRSTSSSHSSSTIKPLPAPPQPAPVHEPYRDDPPNTHHNDPSTYRDEPSSTYRDDPPPHAAASHANPPAYHHQQRPYTDSAPVTPLPTDDNIPLAYLIPPYPSNSPPPYSVAIRETLLIQHQHPYHAYAPSQTPYHDAPIFPTSRRRDVLVEIDPESGEVVSRTDDVRHGVEKVVAMFVVAVVLLFLSGFLGFIAFGS
ncbi:hypothetical protein HBH56_057710 [Parastagonospora nodorum]|uniref:Uncharacterized protein n=1 Tax=Phaeosphaeria nodorum (strain SN15 / ATCC MYA-4574 / FGSC 10173) TaxID=321614 RepID=A0A7U2HTW0_PHANO|nr:hypothetical protein HBH56_057710 [Parastagonospora nodorum]QRC91665.1 hypothetical protein JI435_018860 [Parastagonospora nodorum SN15]KAH3930682.1 hypothetical protein HBH54_101640 [Parastagonospora nodorum]KAH4121271.1 hypothetical protein HBH47_098610 [Parastagonospora nodorum]KAH4140842.1 hypothetical protein HBH45_080150 [Parastagonospora nodorum]